MSSPPEILISLCVIRIEIKSEDKEESVMDQKAKKMQGSREPRDLTVETYSDPSERPPPILSQKSGSIIKTQSSSRENSEEKSYASAVSTSASNPDSSAGATASNVSSDQINFISGHPFVEVTKGILHLFKENTLTEMRSAANQSKTICILSVPANMTCHDLIAFTAACHQNIQYFRIVRDENPNHYMVIMTFRSSTAASEFYETFNGVAYNSLEPEIVCHMVFVSRVETVDNGDSLAGHTELPSCPVCLEKMDESVDGILTVLCNHSYHAGCLVKWGYTSCPVCRCAQTPQPIADSHCMECDTEATNEALWICLICGHIGCGRYDQSHAFEHYTDTHHCYAMELGNNRVWDYVSDHWVDRLLQNKDGKMIEGGQETSKSGRVAADEKIDSVQLEFTYLLNSQLELQRQYFEDKVAKVDQRNIHDMKELSEKVECVTEENIKIQNQITSLTREKQAIEKKLQNSNLKLTQVQAQLIEEKELRKALQDNQISWQIKHKQLQDEMNDYKKKKEAETTDLREQLHDLMFFLEAQKEIEKSADKEEIASGRIVMESGSNTSKANQQKSKSKRDKK